MADVERLPALPAQGSGARVAVCRGCGVIGPPGIRARARLRWRGFVCRACHALRVRPGWTFGNEAFRAESLRRQTESEPASLEGPRVPTMRSLSGWSTENLWLLHRRASAVLRDRSRGGAEDEADAIEDRGPTRGQPRAKHTARAEAARRAAARATEEIVPLQVEEGSLGSWYIPRSESEGARHFGRALRGGGRQEGFLSLGPRKARESRVKHS